MSTKLSIGIVGLPNVGKSTMFNALTKNSVPAENYPFCTIDPSVGVVEVPDKRLWDLSVLSQTKRTIPAVVEFVDIAGLVKGASTGEGLGNKFLSHIRETDAIAEVVRIFEDEKVMHVNDKVDPLFDIEVINFELIQADLETCRNRKSNIQKDVKKGDKKYIMLDNLIDKLLTQLESDKLVSQMYKTEKNIMGADFSEEEMKEIKMLNLITAKKFLYVLNKKAGGKNLDEINDPRYVTLIEYLDKNNFDYVKIDAKIEDDLKDFEGEEKDMMRSELGGKEDGIKDLIVGGYKMLGLESYFTTGVEETRAWTIKKGSTAPVAGQAIHNDFKDRFIRAQVVDCETLLTLGSFAKCKENGKLRMEGKEYIVKDGDVIEFFV
jgi:GTP-binding protein YchF